MKDYLLGKLWLAQVKTKDFFKNLVTNEEGDTNFVSIILIIVIVIAVATIFREQLLGLIENVMGQVSDFVNE